MTIQGGSQGPGTPLQASLRRAFRGDWPGDDRYGLLRAYALHSPFPESFTIRSFFSEKWLLIHVLGRVSRPGTPSAGKPAPGLFGLDPLVSTYFPQIYLLGLRSIPGRRSVKTAPGRIWAAMPVMPGMPVFLAMALARSTWKLLVRIPTWMDTSSSGGDR